MTPGRRESLVLLAAGLAAAAAGFLAGPILLRKGEGHRPLPPDVLVDLAGRPRQLAEWQGRGVGCNFWATWCAPCREEIPLLIAASDRFGPAGVEIVGIAIDSSANVVEFARTFAISYHVLIADATGLDMMRRLGNSSGGLPYTVFFDRRGEPTRRKLGALKPGDLDSILRSMTSV